MERLIRLLGMEADLADIDRALRYHVEEEHPAAVGALLVTCADESERECSEVFQKAFVDHLLPAIKFWTRAPLRCSNLGGRYEWGSLPIAEQHFALPETAGAFKTVVVKINSHVAVSGEGDQLRFGRMDRYNTKSVACGALHALLDGNPLPGLSDVVNAFESEDMDRLAILRNPAQVDPAHRALYAAVLNVRLQARHAVLDVQDHRPVTPTKYIVAACVTLNRSTSDTELLCGYYTADRRTGDEGVHYRGLGDDPAQYHVSFNASRLCIEDEQMTIRRPARNHRQLVAEAWERHLNNLASGCPTSLLPAEDVPHATSTEQSRQLAQIMKQAKSCIHGDPCHVKPMLLALLGALKVISPTPAAFILFAEGLGSIYHAHRLLRRHPEHQGDARALLREIIRHADALTPERSRYLTERLLSYYAPALPR